MFSENLEKEIEQIKLCIIKIFQNDKVDKTIDNNFSFEDGIDFDDLDCNDIIRSFIPFINGFANEDKEEIMKYIENSIKLNIFTYRNDEKDNINSIEVNIHTMKYEINRSEEEKYVFNPVKIYNSVRLGEINRKDKIFLNNKLKGFSIEFVDWEDKEFLTKLAQMCYYKSLLLLKSVLNEESMKSKSNDVANNEKIEKMPKVFNLMKCGHLNPFESSRESLLQRKIKPTKTLDEYVDSVMADMKLREESKSVNKDDESTKSVNKNNESKDEFDEFKRKFRGNTKNIS